MSAQLAKRFLPDLRVVRGGVEVQPIQGKAADFRAAVVTAGAISVQHRLLRILHCSSGLQERRSGDQNQKNTYVKETLHRLFAELSKLENVSDELRCKPLRDLHLRSPWVRNE